MNKVFALLSIVVFLFVGCESDDIQIAPEPSLESQLSDYQQDVVDYFVDIALGFEFGNAARIVRKWRSPMRIFVGGEGSDELISELDTILIELNELTGETFSVSRVNSLGESNYHIVFDDADAYASKYPEQADFVDSNWGLFWINWNSANDLTSGHMYVDITRANAVEQRHLLREEFTQSLGLARDSPRYESSIFQQDWTRVTEFAEIDRELIRLLYHPQVRPGMNQTEVRSVLAEILLAE